MDLTPLATFIKTAADSENPELRYLAQKLKTHLPGSDLFDKKEQETVDPVTAGKMEDKKPKELEDHILQQAMPELEENDKEEKKQVEAKTAAANLWDVLKARM